MNYLIKKYQIYNIFIKKNIGVISDVSIKNYILLRKVSSEK